MRNASPSSKSAAWNSLAALSAAYPDLGPALTRTILARAHAFMTGVSLYQKHPVRRGPEDAPVLWSAGSTKLRDYAPQAQGAPVILVVPSLINRFTILDLMPNHSLLRFLAARGFRPLVLDWDAPSNEEKSFGFEAYVLDRLIPALRIASLAGPAHVVGYCMGGNLALALTALAAPSVRTLTLLSTPWDFHAGYQAMGEDGAFLDALLPSWTAGFDCLPVEFVQSIFSAFQPLQAFRKFSSFAALDPSSVEAARFVLTEDWLNDGVPLTLPAARESFGSWGARNDMAKGRWGVAGKTIDPTSIDHPAYVVVPDRDRIVPPQSAMPLAQALPNATYVEPTMGHVGIMAGADAPTKVWEPLAAWIRGYSLTQ
ncbi:MAG: alpha/beta fold hydrolase [Alphaproteobacteria bacterium]|nr:alpha/beta fold hydrolase [Alphaproteobacteria bacterium]